MSIENAIPAAVALCLLSGMAVTPTATAQSYPTKSVRVISSSGTGSPGDIALRIAAAKMTTTMGQTVVVETRPGASGGVAVREVVRLGPDGYTLLFASTMVIVSPFLVKNLNYKMSELTPVSLATSSASFLAVHPSVPVNTLAEFIDYAKRNPGKLSYSSNGVGSTLQLVGENFKLSAGIDMVHIPYSTGGEAVRIPDFVAGRLNVEIASYVYARQFLSSGKAKVLAHFGTKPHRLAPQIPLATEVLPNYQPFPSWWGFLAPAGTPRGPINRFQEELRNALRQVDVVAKLDEIGIDAVASTPEEYAAEIKSGNAIISQITQALGIKPE